MARRVAKESGMARREYKRVRNGAEGTVGLFQSPVKHQALPPAYPRCRARWSRCDNAMRPQRPRYRSWLGGGI
eukprot:3844993-Rhodomonas_salina.1